MFKIISTYTIFVKILFLIFNYLFIKILHFIEYFLIISLTKYRYLQERKSHFEFNP